ncbi:hypothetical protein [Clostridium cylindrosporum]|uniref:Flagellar hook-length control protein FliK n=1 Tax=Clostridium cylindrosporum DSM 605 TaxID=1121307 RepID=A0A0J8D997_CLOCY|nr:hypothetical protein [Clostridium cylindrosporum]KMT20858.1 hypothetical protein CLCY_1c00920 [Clostridium cylindrosporum DSM 605]
MYIKNISQILNLKGEDKQNLSKGSLISAKVLSLSEGKGVVQLQNGVILPSIFLIDDSVEENKSYRFKVKEYTNDKIILEILNKEGSNNAKKSDIGIILEKLNISKSEGQEIISKLIKYNIPATNENILNLHNNFNFLKELRGLSNADLINLINGLTGKVIDENSKEFLALKNAINLLDNVDLDFLTFLEQNKIPATLENILKVNDFFKNPMLLNDFIENVQSLDINKLTCNLDINFLDDSTVENLCDQLKVTKENLGDILKFLKDNSIDINNITKQDLLNIQTLIPKENSSFSKSFEPFINSLKNLILLNELSLKDDSLSENISKSIKNSIGIDIDKSVIKDVSLAIRENPSFSASIKSSLPESSDFLRLCQNITKNPSLKENSPEVLILKEFSKGSLDEILNIKYSKADKFESLLLKSFTLDTASSKDILSGRLSSMNLSLSTIKDSPEVISKLSPQLLNLLGDNLDVNKYLNNNYTMFNFNFYTNENLYKNNIIIKNKYSSKYIDINDVKLYISVETKNMGLIEGYVSKKFNDIILNLKVNKDYITQIKQNIKKLETKIINMGYNVVNISIEPSSAPATLVGLSDFFSEGVYSDLDVRV